jgi:hypothetical protein
MPEDGAQRPMPSLLAGLISPALWQGATRLGMWGFVWRGTVWYALTRTIVHVGWIVLRQHLRSWRDLWMVGEIPAYMAGQLAAGLVIVIAVWIFLRVLSIEG